jgi:hypothetical protein
MAPPDYTCAVIRKELIDKNTNQVIGSIHRYTLLSKVAISITLINPSNECKPIRFRDDEKPMKFLNGLMYQLTPRSTLDNNFTEDVFLYR